MKDNLARVLAIIALVTMVLFVAALVATLVDYTLLNNGIGFIALGFGVFTMMIFIALKADGRGFSMTKMNNEIEMKKIEDELAEAEKDDGANSDSDNSDDKESVDEERENIDGNIPCGGETKTPSTDETKDDEE